MKQFPHLTPSLNFNDAVDLWHGKLRTHFKNHRFRNRENIPEILKKQYMAKGMQVSRQQVKWFQPKKFLAGGLSTSFQISLKEKMNTTWNHKKDHALISRLMRKIFPHRRQLLIKDLIPLSGLLQQYPMLCSEEQLSLICYLGLFGSR